MPFLATFSAPLSSLEKRKGLGVGGADRRKRRGDSGESFGACISEALGKGWSWDSRKMRLPLGGGQELCPHVGMAGIAPTPPPAATGHRCASLMRFSQQPAFLPALKPLHFIAALSRSGGVKTRD